MARRTRSNHRQSQRHKILKRDGSNCWICGLEFTENKPATIDHLQEAASGGSNKLDNLKLAHRKCNNLRSNKPNQQWAELMRNIINTTKFDRVDIWEDDGGFCPTKK